jgi:outer membrane protein assembly factor BamB
MDGKIFGSDGREDQGGGTYKCIREEDGNLVWKQPDMPISHTIGVGQKLLICGIDGQLWCLRSSATKFEPIWKTNLPKGVFRAIPALSDNHLFVRTSSGNGDALYCFELK